MFQKSVASKEQVKLMIGLTGPSGSGKTYSALQLAYGITKDWSKIAVADTENRSALYYAGDKTGAWEHIDFAPTVKEGYHPKNYVELIKFAEADPKTEVLIIDSISHEWQACLGLVDVYARANKGQSFGAWKIVTPLHDEFVNKMRNSRLHVIATMRSVSEYSMEKNENGKTAPKKIGMKPTQRDGIDYEFGIIFDIDISHYATSTKDRTNLFMDQPPFLITSEVGEKLKDWAKDGLSEIHQRVNRILASFANFGISSEDLEKFTGTSPEEFTEDDIKKINEIWPKVSKGGMSRDDLLLHAQLQAEEELVAES
jgi:hypothetical protein